MDTLFLLSGTDFMLCAHLRSARDCDTPEEPKVACATAQISYFRNSPSPSKALIALSRIVADEFGVDCWKLNPYLFGFAPSG